MIIDDVASAFICLPEVINTQVSKNCIRVEVEKGELAYELCVNFDEGFPRCLPEIVLNDAKRFGLLPHVCWKSVVCYDEGEGNSIDTRRPVDVAVYALQRALNLLPSVPIEDLSEFYSEFEGYWARQESVLQSYIFFDPGNKFSEVRVIQKGKSHHPVAIVDPSVDREQLREYGLGNKLINGSREVRGYFLPLRDVVAPPLPGEPLCASFLTSIFSSLSDSDRALWEEVVQNKELPNRLMLLFSQPRRDHSKSLFGVYIPPKVVRKILASEELSDDVIFPISLARQDSDYLAKRGGLDGVIGECKVAVIGCGSLGGRIAELCVQSGFTTLTLVDGDNFEGENLYRHVLGSEHIGKNKAQALSEHFKSRFHGLNIDYENSFRAEIGDLIERMDIVIVAIGDPTQEREFNEQYFSVKCGHPASLITSWLEAGGVGGHAIKSASRSAGCLHCLYHKDNSFQLNRKTDFVAPGQVVTRNLTGCGSGHIPFGAIHVQKTAIICVELLLNTVLGKSQNPQYSNWADDSSNTTLKLTQYFGAVIDMNDRDYYPISDDGCPVCRCGKSK